MTIRALVRRQRADRLRSAWPHERAGKALDTHIICCKRNRESGAVRSHGGGRGTSRMKNDKNDPAASAGGGIHQGAAGGGCKRASGGRGKIDRHGEGFPEEFGRDASVAPARAESP